MGTEAKKIFEQAMALPLVERLRLLDALNESLEPEKRPLSPEWAAEIRRRIEALERGESRLVPGDEVEARIRRSLSEV